MDMYMIMENVFPHIWDNGFSCKTILFGNGYCRMEKESGPNECIREEFENELKYFFAVYCQNTDDLEWKDRGTTQQEKKDLLPETPIELVTMEEKSTHGLDIEKLTSLWMDREKLEKIKKDPNLISSEDMSVKGLIKRLDIHPNAVVALDVVLLYDDFKRIEEGLPSISMALLYELAKSHECYLYSAEYISRKVVDIWIKTYYELYGQEKIVKIHPKNGLTTRMNPTREKAGLIELLKKVEEKNNHDDKS